MIGKELSLTVLCGNRVMLFHSQSSGLRLEKHGISHGLTNSPPDCLLPSLRSGRPFDSTYLSQKERPPVRWPFFLEQDTGVEPAFTAWEAVVLPIYESCVGKGIIAKGNGNFNLFLSKRKGPAGPFSVFCIYSSLSQRPRRYTAQKASDAKSQLNG